MRAFVVGNYMNANFLHLPRLPKPGETVAATGIFREHGGKGFNLAVALRRLGAEVAALLTLGRDDPGAAATAFLASQGIDVSGVHAVETPSGYGVGLIDDKGANMLLPFLGANTVLDESHVAASAPAIAAADWTLAQFEAPQRAVLPALRLAKAAGRRTYLNPSPWQEMSAELETLVDVLVVNESEGASFFAQPGLAEAPLAAWREALTSHCRALKWSGRWLVVTLAARGAVARRPDGAVIAAPAYAIEQIDATGAGDAFGAGFVLALHEGFDDPLGHANACGAMVARAQGVLDALPTRKAAQAFARVTPRVDLT